MTETKKSEKYEKIISIISEIYPDAMCIAIFREDGVEILAKNKEIMDMFDNILQNRGITNKKDKDLNMLYQ